MGLNNGLINSQSVVTYSNSYSSNFELSEPLMQYDSIRGYRLASTDKACRNLKITKNVVEYDVQVNVNNVNLSSHYNYQKEKPDSVTRLIVFGDSFSAGLFMDSSWVDILQANFIAKGLPIELYNFSIDGGGLTNWHQIYLNEILPYYQHDGVIIASYLDNLRRPFFSLSSTSSEVRGGYFNDTIPSQGQVEEDGDTLYRIVEQREMDNHFGQLNDSKQTYHHGFNLLLFSIEAEGIYTLDKHIELQANWLSTEEIDLNFEDITHHIGPSKFELLEELLDSIEENEKSLFLSGIPDKYGIRSSNGKIIKSVMFLEAIAEEYKATSYDPYPNFATLPQATIDSLWLPYDLHWGQAGARHFANLYAEELEKQLSIKQ